MGENAHEALATGSKQQRRALMAEVSHEEEVSADYPKAVFTGEEERYTPPELLDAARDALTWEKWPECEAMSRLTGAERLTLAAATQRHARMAALGRRSPERKPPREAMSRPTIDGIVGSITDTTGAGRPRSRATGGQREENPRYREPAIWGFLGFSSPRTVYSPLTSLAKNQEPAYLRLLRGFSL